MFTGIVEEMGTLEQVQRGQHSAVLTIRADKVLEHTKIGDSIAVNGICLTVTALSDGHFCADVMHETLNRSALSGIKRGTHVNLERAMAADGRFGGHIVSGHIDGTGTVASITKDSNAVRFQILAPEEILRGIVEKGSVAIDGISLTVTAVEKDRFEVSVIPHTLGETVLSDRKKGSVVNLENDIIGKYVERLLAFEKENAQSRPALTKEFLIRAGF